MIQVIYIYIFPILNLGWSFLSSPGVGDLRYHPAAREGDFQDLEDLPSRAMFWCLEFSGKANSKLHEQEILEKKIGGCKLHGGNSREKKGPVWEGFFRSLLFTKLFDGWFLRVSPGSTVKVPESHHRVSPYCQRLNFGKPIKGPLFIPQFTRFKVWTSQVRSFPKVREFIQKSYTVAMGPVHVPAKYWDLGRGILHPHHMKPRETLGKNEPLWIFFTNLSGSTKPFESRRISQKSLGGCFQVAVLVGWLKFRPSTFRPRKRIETKPFMNLAEKKDGMPDSYLWFRRVCPRLLESWLHLWDVCCFAFFFGGESDFLFIAKRWKKPRELAVASWSFSTSGNFFRRIWFVSGRSRWVIFASFFTWEKRTPPEN